MKKIVLLYLVFFISSSVLMGASAKIDSIPKNTDNKPNKNIEETQTPLYTPISAEDSAFICQVVDSLINANIDDSTIFQIADSIISAHIGQNFSTSVGHVIMIAAINSGLARIHQDDNNDNNNNNGDPQEPLYSPISQEDSAFICHIVDSLININVGKPEIFSIADSIISAHLGQNFSTSVGHVIMLAAINSALARPTSVRVEQNKESKPSFYPNPAINAITFTNVHEIYKIIISDLNGQALRIIDSNEETININDMKKGIYSVMFIAKDGGSNCSRLIKK